MLKASEASARYSILRGPADVEEKRKAQTDQKPRGELQLAARLCTVSIFPARPEGKRGYCALLQSHSSKVASSLA